MRNLLACLPAPVLALALAFAFAACGDDPHTIPDTSPDPGPDVIQRPDPPALGVQIDRMGRPAISTMLLGTLDTSDLASMKREAYNLAADPNQWGSTQIAPGRSVLAELAANLAVLDVIDQGNLAIPGTPGCNNQMLYNGNLQGGGTPGPTSYSQLAVVLADDMLYLDTMFPACTKYFSLEIELASGTAINHKECGGRAPTPDVIDVTYSALLSGFFGFTPQPALVPRIADGVAPRAGLSNTVFPYFGSPH
jgi:hypothetical protein